MSKPVDPLAAGARGKSSGPRGGKGATMATRITREMRAALEAEAERSGRSIGQVAELWLEEARQLNALGPLRAEVTVEIVRFLQFAAAVTRHLGNPMRSILPHSALCIGWGVIAYKALPKTTDDESRNVSAATWLAQQALDILPDIAEDSRFSSHRDKFSRLPSLLKAVAEGRLNSNDPDWRQETARLAEMLAIMQDVMWDPRSAEHDNEALLSWSDLEETTEHLSTVLRTMRKAALAHDANTVAHEDAIQHTVLLLAETGAIAADEVAAIGRLVGRLAYEAAERSHHDLDRHVQAASGEPDDEPPGAA
jgi:hypothetical protein